MIVRSRCRYAVERTNVEDDSGTSEPTITDAEALSEIIRNMTICIRCSIYLPDLCRFSPLRSLPIKK
jgi:hypothetical protein